MKRTRISTLLGLVLLGAVVGFLVDLGVAAAGLPVLVPPLTVPLTLVVVAALVIAFAVPIHQATKGTVRRRIDPFRAMRVVVLAKASSHVGALLLGASAGILVYLLSRSVIPSLGSVWQDLATLAGAIVLLVAGLVAEHLCTIPPSDDDDPAVGEVNHA